MVAISNQYKPSVLYALGAAQKRELISSSLCDSEFTPTPNSIDSEPHCPVCHNWAICHRDVE
jgi:hypothetical protein